MSESDRLLDELIQELVGDDTVPLVHYIKNREDVSEFKIAERLDLGINQIRNMLYRLSNYHLVSFIRKKDRKKGWYIYYWTFNVKQANELMLKLKRKKLDRFRTRLAEISKESLFDFSIAIYFDYFSWLDISDKLKAITVKCDSF